jgi:hypothetical protein
MVRDRIKRIAMMGMFCLLLPLLAVTCVSAPRPGSGVERLHGTWVSKELIGTYFAWKVEYDADGSALAWIGKEGDPHSNEGRYRIEKTWVDSQGSTWYHVFATWGYVPYNEAAAGPNKWYDLVKISADGFTMDSESSQVDYPSAFGALGSRHGVSHRQ